MENYTPAQKMLFETLGEICEGVGRERAVGLAKSIAARVASANVGVTGDACSKEEEMLREQTARLDKTLEPTKANEQSLREKLPTKNDDYKALTLKYNALAQNQKELLETRAILEKELRDKKQSLKGWSRFANALQEKRQRTEQILGDSSLSSDQKVHLLSIITLTDVAASPFRSFTSTNSVGSSLGFVDRRTPERSFGAARGSDVGAAMAETRCQVPRSDDVQVERTRLPELTEEVQTDDVELPALNMDERLPTSPQGKKNRISQSHRSSSTQGDSDPIAVEYPVQPDNTPRTFVKEESPSDVPVVVFSRSVRKRMFRNGNGRPEDKKIKVEVLTSSPVGIAGFRSLHPHESMDLDEIGEKIETPKKRRTVVYASSSNIGRPISRAGQSEIGDTGNLADGQNTTKALLLEAVGPSIKMKALQPASPNKLILPRTSGNERQAKRRRLDETVKGARIFGEDGENGSLKISPTGSDSEKPRRRLPAEAAELGHRLNGLLEHQSSPRKVLTPARPSSSTPQQKNSQMGLIPVDKSFLQPTGERPPTSLRRQIGTRLTPNAAPSPTTNQKASTGRKRVALTPDDHDDTDGPDDEPLRARLVHRLGLEHFKINPNYNQGFNYAFSDVVRGREQRKCLQGCTRHECCGAKFRRFVEMTARTDSEPTRSQEEEEERLLEEYMGDMYGRSLSEAKRKELLIQAKTRELAQKAGRHRHAYERRRSPPGFWRADFPDTQELKADREEAKKVERDLVQQRWEEAVRPGGKWIFRDE